MESVYLGYNFYGAETDAQGLLTSFTLLVVELVGDLDSPEETAAAMDLIWALDKAMRKTMGDENEPLIFLSSSHEQASWAVAVVGRRGVRWMPLVTVVLSIFCVCVSVGGFSDRRAGVAAGLAAVSTPLMAVGSGYGLLVALGVELSTMATASPPVVMAIGVDDAFLMIHALRHTRRSRLDPVQRMALAMQKVGASVTITSVTTAVSFGIGASTGFQMLHSFAVFLSVAVAFDFLYQMTAYVALLSWVVRREHGVLSAAEGGSEDGQPKPLIGEAAKPFAPPLLVAGEPVKPLHKDLEASGARLLPRPSLEVDSACSDEAEEDKLNPRLEKISAVLAKPVVFCTILLLYLGYIATAVYGVFHLQVGFEATKAFPPGTPFKETMRIMEEGLVLENGVPALVIVHSPGDLANSSHMERLRSFQHRLETLPRMVGSVSTQFFLDAYERHVAAGRDASFCPPFSRASLEEFLSREGNEHWATMAQIDEDACPKGDCAKTHCLAKLAFRTGIRAPGAEKGARVRQWRALAASEEFRGLNVTVFHDIASVHGQNYNSLEKIVRETIAFALAAMCGACVIFIPRLLGVALAVSAVLSVNIGVLGSLGLLGGDLGSFTLCTILAIVGLSVDYVSHSAVHVSSADGTVQQRIRHTLGSVGGPSLASGFSTLLGNAVFPIFVQDYVTWVYFKSLLLVVSIGLVHGMLFIPVFGSRLPRSKRE